MSGNSQRTRLRHFRMVGSEWLTRVPIHNNPVAQLVEQHPFKVMVVGSNPTGITMLLQTVTIILLFICLKSGNLYCKLIKELYEF